MIYSIYEIQQRIAPVAKQYGVKAVFLFGSYARGEAREDSDIDLLVDTSGTNLRSLLSLGALYCDLEAALQKPIDLITVSALEQRAQMPSEEMFRETVMKERLNVYDAITAKRSARPSNAMEKALRSLIRMQIISVPLHFPFCRSVS